MSTTQSGPSRIHALLMFPAAVVIGFTLNAAVTGVIDHFTSDRGTYVEEQHQPDATPRTPESDGAAPAERSHKTPAERPHDPTAVERT